MSQVVYIPIYIDRWKALTEALTEADRNKLIGAYLDYAATGKEPKGLSKTCNVLFQFMKLGADDLWKNKGGAPLNNHNAKKKTTDEQPVETTEKQPVNSTENNPFIQITKNKRQIQERESQRENGAPTLDEVRNFCREKKLKLNATRFFKYFQGRGWQIDGIPIHDWRAIMESWAESDKGDQPEKEPPKQRVDMEKCRSCGSDELARHGDRTICEHCGKGFDWNGSDWQEDA